MPREVRGDVVCQNNKGEGPNRMSSTHRHIELVETNTVDGVERPDGQEIGNEWLRLENAYQQYRPELESYLTRLTGEPEAARDIVQETFARVSGIKEPARLNGGLKAYLYKTALNLVRDEWRRTQTRTANWPMLVADSLASDPACAQDDVIWHKQRLQVVKAALKELKPSVAGALLLHQFHGLTYVEIAAELNVSTRTVERYIKRAIEHCLKRLQALDDPLD